ncbi:hypothetical protein BGY98DRAFT_1177398 [Russula aff. rugulosa BPL654]|nr:hypothetical protein BGY98DRAFT_1177398 [Russula aff. rugulosa BPL654]
MISPIEHMEDLILVTVCTSFTSWAAAAFKGCLSVDIATISLEARKSDGGGAQFIWRNIRGNVDFRNSPNVQELQPQNQCVFIRGTMRAATEPLPDDPDDHRDDEIQVTRIPDSPKYRDPLSGVLDHTVEVHPPLYDRSFYLYLAGQRNVVRTSQ